MNNRYATVITACCFLFVLANVGFPSTSFSVYQPYIVELPGVGHTGGSLVVTLRTASALVAMFFVHRYYNKLDCRVGVSLAGLMVAAGFVCFGFARGLALLCVGAAVAGMGYGLGGIVAMTMLLGRWHRQHVSVAIGIATAGSGVASIVIPYVVTHLAENYSLQVPFFLEAILAAIVAVICFVLLRNNPPEVQAQTADQAIRKVDEDTTSSSAAETNSLQPGSATTSRKSNKPAFTKHARWMMVLAMVCIGCVSVPANSYFSVLLTSQGYGSYFTAILLSVIGICLTLSKLVSGAVFDKIGALKGSALFLGICFVSLVLCCLTALHIPLIAILAAVLYGTGMIVGTVGISIWSLEFSMLERRQKTIRDMQLGYSLGGFIFNFFPGLLHDLLGTYVISYAGFAILGLLAAIIIVYEQRTYVGKYVEV